MTEKLFDIGADAVDTAAIVADIRASVKIKLEQGVYNDGRIARAERMNLPYLRDEADFLAFYTECIKDSVYVDINDFEILERRRGLGSLLVPIKKTLWKLLRFYTYRLWSQQNQVNGLLLTAFDGMEHHYRKRVETLEQRIAALEKKLNGPS